MKLSKKKILIIVFIVLLLVAVVVLRMINKEKAVIQPTAEELLDDLGLINKHLAISVYEEDINKTNIIIADAYQTWEDYMAAVKSEEKDSILTKAKEKVIIAVTEYLRKADELVKEGKTEEAIEEMAKAREGIDKIIGEAEDSKFASELFDLYIEVEKIRHAPKKTQVEEILPELKLKYTMLKAYSFDEEYDRLILELEIIIGKLDKFLDGPDFQKARADLDRVFFELYNKY